MNTLEAANLKPGEALWVWDGVAELDAPVWGVGWPMVTCNSTSRFKPAAVRFL